MGADRRMFAEPVAALPQVILLDWPRDTTAKSISDMATELIDQHAITRNDWVGGCSLGGMVACEMASQLKLAGAILIGSAMHPRELRWYARLGLVLANHPTFVLSCRSAGFLHSLFFRMLHETQPAFLTQMCAAIRHWTGARPDLRLLRVHGTRDLLIKTPAQAVKIVGGGHMISSTHGEQVASALFNWIQLEALKLPATTSG